MKKLFKGFLLTATALSLVFCAVGCGESKPATTTTKTKTEQKSAATATTETTKTTSDSSSTVEYTTADAKFTAPDGLKKVDDTAEKITIFKDGSDGPLFLINDVGYWLTSPYEGNMPKTKEEFDPTCILSPSQGEKLSVNDFQYSETTDAEYWYAEISVSADKYNYIKYLKYSIKKNDPQKIIYMDVQMDPSYVEKYGKAVQSFDWK